MPGATVSYRFTVDARDDLRAAADYYESQRDGLGLEFALEVGIGLAKITEAPGRWPRIESDARKYRIARFPYGIIYRIDDGGRAITVVAVFDLRRKPGSWQRPGG